MSTWGRGLGAWSAMSPKDYVSIFVQTYRAEARMLLEKETGFLRREEILPAPCQVEVIQFDGPFLLVWVFLFSQNREDLTVTYHTANREKLDAIVKELKNKYPAVDQTKMRKMLEGFCDLDAELNYSINGFEGVLGICFPQDIRLGWRLSDPGPRGVAKAIFYLNLGQAQDC